METIKIDIKDLIAGYPDSEWPCLEYTQELLRTGHKKDSRLEVWNYERNPSEADWIVENIGFYAKNAPYTKKQGNKHQPFHLI